MAIEDLNHLFWDCYLADIVWSITKVWLGVNFNNYSLHYFSIDHLLNLKMESNVKKYWYIFAAASLWIIWKSRNDCVFNNIRKTKDDITFMIKSVSYSWMSILDWVPKPAKGIYKLWDLNPIGFLKVQVVNQKDCLLNVIFSNSNFVAFTDGSWALNHGNIAAGIGGVLFNTNREICFLFSGPSKGSSPLDTEREASVFLLEKLAENKELNLGRITLCIDSYWLRKELEYLIFEKGFLAKADFSISIVQCERDINSEADYLAKNGAKLRETVTSWTLSH